MWIFCLKKLLKFIDQMIRVVDDVVWYKNVFFPWIKIIFVTHMAKGMVEMFLVQVHKNEHHTQKNEPVQVPLDDPFIHY